MFTVHVSYYMVNGSSCCSCNRRGRGVSCSCVKVVEVVSAVYPNKIVTVQNFSVQSLALITLEADIVDINPPPAVT